MSLTKNTGSRVSTKRGTPDWPVRSRELGKQDGPRWEDTKERREESQEELQRERRVHGGTQAINTERIVVSAEATQEALQINYSLTINTSPRRNKTEQINSPTRKSTISAGNTHRHLRSWDMARRIEGRVDNAHPLQILARGANEGQPSIDQGMAGGQPARNPPG